MHDYASKASPQVSGIADARDEGSQALQRGSVISTPLALRSTCRMPQELCDTIFDYLHDDLEALRQCALTCKAWVPPSTLHLFSRFSWPPCGIYWSPREPIQTCECTRHDVTFAECHALLTSSPRIRRHVRDLRFTGVRCPTGRYSDEHVYDYLPRSLLFAVGDLFPSLRTVEIWDLRWLQGVPPDGLLSRCSLQRLELVSTEISITDTTIMTIISTFKHIGTLSLDCDCDTGTDLSRNALAHCVDKMTITHLEISSHRTVLPVTRRLQEVVDTHALQTATVRQPLDEGTQALLRSAPALDSLSYTVFGTAPLFPSPLALRFLNLSFFMEFDALTSPTPDQPHAEWHSMLQHLRALQLPDLRELSVTILLEEGDYFPPSEVEDPPQATFADALAAHIQKNWDWVSLKVTLDRYPTLKKLKIVVLADDEWGSVTRIVPYLACAGQVVHDIAERSFGGERGRCLEVVAEHRWYGDVYHHFP